MESFSLIIATFERPEDLALTFAGVECQTRKPAEILVVDSSRDDRTRKVCEEWAARLPIRYMFSEAKSAAKQRNQGALAAAESSGVLGFMDDDITMQPDTCALICEVFDRDEKKEVGGVAMRIDEIVRPRPSRFSRWYYRVQAGYSHSTYGGKLFGPAINCLPCYDEPQEGAGLIRAEWLNTAGVFFRREPFLREKFPEFDGYSSMEDVHCSARIGKTHRLYFHALARCSHREGMNSLKRNYRGIARQRIENQRTVARDVMGLGGFTLAWKFFLHRIFVTIAILRTRNVGWTQELRGDVDVKIHGICVVKNEGDVMRYFLSEAVRWCDAIYILDNGSTDGTWEIAREVAEKHPQVVAWRQEMGPFTDALRGEVFREFKSRAQKGDWWCRLDADEVYIDDPRAFLASVPRAHHVVWSVHLQDYLTPGDLARFAPDEEDAPAPEIHAGNLPRFYVADASEARLFRHRPGLEWPAGAWPRHLGLVTSKRIRLKHLQYRSPAQARARFATRRDVGLRGGQMFDHWAKRDWKETLKDPAQLQQDTGDGRFVVDEAKLPRHLESPTHRLVKRVMHGLGLWE